MTVPGIWSSNLAVASAPERSLQSATSPAPTRIAPGSLAGVPLEEWERFVAKTKSDPKRRIVDNERGLHANLTIH